MGDTFPRTSFLLAVIGTIGAAIVAFESGWRHPSSLFFIGCAVLSVAFILMWGLSTSVLLLRDNVTITFDKDGGALIEKRQTVFPLRRTVSGLDERVASEGEVVIEEMSLDDTPCQFVILALTKIQSRVRQVLRTDLRVLHRHERIIRIRMLRSFCGPREWYEVSAAYTTRLYALKLVFPEDRAPKGNVEIFRKRGSAELKLGSLEVTANGASRHVVWKRAYPGMDVLYRFEWDWDPVGNGQNDGQGSISQSGTHPAQLPAPGFLTGQQKSLTSGTGRTI